MVPVTILTGFLGSGKTTLLNRILKEDHGQRIAVIENEFGEAGVDAEIVEKSEEQIVEMNNGCICCTVRGDLIRILGTLKEKRDQGALKFDRVMIETTGMADPGPVAQTFFVDENVGKKARLDAVVTVADAKWLRDRLRDAPEAKNQIAFADVILLNKTDLVSEADLIIAVGLGALEYVLDKGQEDDWFNSHTIVIFATIAAVALVSFVLWEWRQEHPVVEVRLFRDRNFAVANLMMLVMGMALYGSTVLLPLYLQMWLGYSAQDAGMVLSPGGVIVILLLPLVGKLLSKVDARYLIAFGFLVTSTALLHMAHTLHPGIDFRAAVLMRMFQASGIAFLFVPINSIVYNGIPPQKNNQVSGIVNLSRNMGGDIGIALVTTLIARRSQFHQSRLVEHVVPSGDLNARLAAMAQHLQQLGVGAVDSTKMAYGQIYREVIRQAQTLAYIDVLVVLAIFTAIMVPAVLLTRRARPGAAATAH